MNAMSVELSFKDSTGTSLKGKPSLGMASTSGPGLQQRKSIETSQGESDVQEATAARGNLAACKGISLDGNKGLEKLASVKTSMILLIPEIEVVERRHGGVPANAADGKPSPR